MKDSKATLGQHSLFSAEQAPIEYLTVEPQTKAEKAWGEYKTLGWFMSEHPSEGLLAKHAASITNQCSDIDHGEIPVEGRVTMGGMVMKVEHFGRLTRVNLQDRTGTAELICFDDEWQRYQWCMKPWSIVVVQLKTRYDAGGRRSLQIAKAHKLGEFQPPEKRSKVVK